MEDKQLISMGVKELTELVVWSYQEGYRTAVDVLKVTEGTVLNDALKGKMEDKIKLLVSAKNINDIPTSNDDTKK